MRQSCNVQHAQLHTATLSRDKVSRQNRAIKLQVWHLSETPTLFGLRCVLMIWRKHICLNWTLTCHVCYHCCSVDSRDQNLAYNIQKSKYLNRLRDSINKFKTSLQSVDSNFLRCNDYWMFSGGYMFFSSSYMLFCVVPFTWPCISYTSDAQLIRRLGPQRNLKPKWRAITGVWMLCPKWGSGAKPRSGDQGQSPLPSLKLTTFYWYDQNFCVCI